MSMNSRNHSITGTKQISFLQKDSTPDTHQQIKMNVRNMTQEYLFEFSVGVPIPEIKKLVHAV